NDLSNFLTQTFLLRHLGVGDPEFDPTRDVPTPIDDVREPKSSKVPLQIPHKAQRSTSTLGGLRG
ncbi:hypothetical protein BDR03DRAFT_922668, partial [Suillus americanus]